MTSVLAAFPGNNVVNRFFVVAVGKADASSLFESAAQLVTLQVHGPAYSFVCALRVDYHIFGKDMNRFGPPHPLKVFSFKFGFDGRLIAYVGCWGKDGAWLHGPSVGGCFG